MTDLRDINSTSNITKDRFGNSIHKVRDSLIAEILMSLIVGLTILSIMTLVKCYVEFIEINTYQQFSLLIVGIVHTIVRRFRYESKKIIFTYHVMVSLAFYLIAIQIPILGFGARRANRIYLVMCLIAFTLFSILYRLRPSFTAADNSLIVFPAVFHVIAYILFSMATQKEYSDMILLHAVMIAIIYVIMRQIAVFDSKYYHSIHKLSRPSAQLKKQNYKTVLILVIVIAAALIVLLIFPYSILSSFFRYILGYILYAIVSVLMKLTENVDLEPTEFIEQEDAGDGISEPDPFINFLANVMFFLVIFVILYIVYKGIRAIARTVPKAYLKEETSYDNNLIDTIENISPEKKKTAVKVHDFGSGYERRIRKQFYDKTKRAMKKGLPVSSSSTPGQIEDVLLENGDKDISSLKKEYEKVRYGKEHLQ